MTHADGQATAARPETAWPLENMLFSAALMARRIPWADLPARTLGLDALTHDGLTSRLMAHLRSSRNGHPVRLRTPFGPFLVPLTRTDAETLLTHGANAGALGTPCALAADGRRHGLSAHPAAGTAAAGAWEAVAPGGPDGLSELSGPDGLSELSGLGGLCDQVAEHLAAVTGARREDGTLDRSLWEAGTQRLSRHVVLGVGAVEDTLLSAMVSAAAGAVGGRAYEARAAALRRRMAPYLADPEPGCLAGRLTAAGPAGWEPHPALAHALALVSAATGATALRALTLLTADTDMAASGARTGATEPAPPATEAIGQAMDRAVEQHPVQSAVVYPVHAPFTAHGQTIQAGEEILYDPALFGPRCQGRRTDPAWALCGNPSGCPTADFAVHVSREVIRQATARPAAIGAIVGTGGTGGQVAGGVRPVFPGARSAVDPLPEGADSRFAAMTAPLAAYGTRGRADADRLDRHAESLSACAAETGWNAGETGERFRMVLLAHAERCARAADDVRRAARWLAD
ncbi:hypothetical protein [Streptomyces sp. NRRL F-2580]|uniref:hypothetical protein n=1 Tax=Streptomyces sp. NRRL F-2580 TaxID=1463841 RepID=UPI0004CA3AF5|nr:hypothetical protein [Streptomyces sp. NRRL F-2580]